MRLDDEVAALEGSVEKAADSALIEELQRRGFLTHKPAPPQTPASFDITRIRGDRIRLGVISDTHFGSKFQQPSLLVEHLRYFKDRKVDAIIHAGDVMDGSTKMHPGFEYEIWAHGADAQIDAAGAVLIPEAERLKVPWYIIGGNHDYSFWRTDGTDVVARLCEQSEWLNYLSPGQGNARGSIGYVRFGKLLVQVNHPHMGSAYALSYRQQKIIEQMSPEAKPHLHLMGNMHKAGWIDYRNVSSFLLPSFQAVTSWMASKGLHSYIGSVIIEVGTDLRGLAPSVTQEWLIERSHKENDWPGG